MVELISVILAVIGLGAALYSVWYSRSIETTLLGEVQRAAEGLRGHIDEELEPLQKNVNKAFGFKAQASADSRQLKAAERMVMDDVLQAQSPEIMAALEFLSPRTKEYLEKNPELIARLLPRLQALSSVEGFNVKDLFNPGTGSENRRHPFGNRE